MMNFLRSRAGSMLIFGVVSIMVMSTDVEAQRKDEWRHVKQERYGRYKVKIPAGASTGKVYPLVVLLHGNGNAPDLMMRWAHDLKLDSFIVVCPEAPYVKVPETIQSLEERYTAMADAIGIPDSLVPEAISFSADWYYNVVLDAQRTLPVDPMIKPILIGFSQGGFYAQVILTRHPETFRKVVTVSASMYAAGKVIERLPDLALANVDILLAHARLDPVVPFQTGELIDAAFVAAKVKHTFLPFDGGHWPTQEVTEAISKWLL